MWAAPAELQTTPTWFSIIHPKEVKILLYAPRQVSWDARDGGYTSEQLRGVFSAHGPVADVVIRAPKQAKRAAGGAARSGSSKGSAFVEMGTLEGAAAAARAANGLPDRPLLVVPFSKVGPFPPDVPG